MMFAVAVAAAADVTVKLQQNTASDLSSCPSQLPLTET